MVDLEYLEFRRRQREGLRNAIWFTIAMSAGGTFLFIYNFPF